MAYSPNDRGPDIPPTRGKTRSTAVWIGLIAIVLIGGLLWSQSGTPTDPATTSSTTQSPASQSPAAPMPGAGTPAAGTSDANSAPATPAQPAQP
ncbi:hypothetical protein [Rhizobium sp. SGZ-381]|uniref:hypothetical protein n=1 Tax=Rhizobium sp. SGZ-381 TaxID=3342800 RepID=UPI0036708BD6